MSVVAAARGSLTRPLHRLAAWWGQLDDLVGDALLYALSALFALSTYIVSATIAESHWGSLATVPYSVAAILAFAASRRHWRSPSTVRLWLLALVILSAMAMPLVMESRWRALDPAGNFGQPEVMVVERAAQALYSGHDPYQAYWHNGHLEHEIPGVPAYESFFPYFPLMGLFGLPAAADHHVTGATDARMIMSGVTVAATATALWLLRPSRRQRIRVWQLLVALPTGSMFLATGGDDMPILALCLLGVALLKRRSTTSAAVTIATAAAMKLTAWPIALGALLVTFEQSGRRAFWRMLAWMAAIGVVTITPLFIADPTTFLANVIAFPLGLAHVPSPAASDLPGHLVTMVSPSLGHFVTPLTLLVGGVVLARYLPRHRPLEVATMLRILAVSSAVIILTASAPRSGYVIYPLNFWLWARVTSPAVDDPRDRDEVSAVPVSVELA